MELLESRLVYWANIEASERAVIEMREIHDWVLAQKDNDVYKKILVTLTEIGTDVKSLIGFAKDTIGGVEDAKKKLEAIWRNARKTKAKEDKPNE